MSDIVSKIVNMSWYENKYSEKCDHKFDISCCNEEGLAVCSECGVGFNELRSE